MVEIKSIEDKKQDLWGDFSKILISHSPRKVLEEQAALLGEKTNGLLTAQIKTFTISHIREEQLKPTVYHAFYVKGAGTGIELFRAVRALKSKDTNNPYYPIDINWEGEYIQNIQSEAEFIDQVRYVLQHELTRAVLVELITKVA